MIMIIVVAIVFGFPLLFISFALWANHRYRVPPEAPRADDGRLIPQLASTITLEDCPHCTGGAQMLLGGKWGKIPWELRQEVMGPRHGVTDNIGDTRPPHANVRSCLTCNGRGQLFRQDKASA